MVIYRCSVGCVLQVSIRAAEIEQSAVRTFLNVLKQLQRRLVDCSVRVWRRRCDICGMAAEAAVKMKLSESHDSPRPESKN